MHTTSSAAGPLVIRVDGVFDVPAAQQVAKTVAGASREVAIDLSQVREFHDFGVAVLAQALTESSRRVAVRGLRQHHVRLLRYLGVDADGSTALARAAV
jgi:anti-anti-sigma regulatory factor